MIAYDVCTSLLAFKAQNVTPIKTEFDVRFSNWKDYSAKTKRGEIARNVEFDLHAELATLSLHHPPLDLLQKQVFEKLSVTERTLSLFNTLNITLQGLRESCERRNALIESYKKGTPKFSLEIYLGLQINEHVNADYPSAIENIHLQTENAVFFSHRLCMDLSDHGVNLAGRYKRKYKKSAPSIRKPNFDHAEKSGLIPNPDKYQDWLSQFRMGKESAQPHDVR